MAKLEDLQEELEQVKSERHQLQHIVGDLEEKLTNSLNEQGIAMQNELKAYRELLPYLFIERDAMRNAVSNDQSGG